MSKKILSVLGLVCVVCVCMMLTACSFFDSSDLKKRLEALEHQHDEMVKLLEDKQTKIDDLESKLNAHNHASIQNQIKDLEKEIAALEQKLKEHDHNSIEKLKKQISVLEREIERLWIIALDHCDENCDHDLPPPIIEDEDLSIHFLELGNRFTGDSVYIQYGDIDIIIDAGSRSSSATTIVNYINRHITDNKIEYVIATHAHQDHIAGFFSTGSGSSRVTGVLDAFEIGTIIDYARTNSTSQTRANYEATRDRLVADPDTDTVHYTALEAYKEINGAQRKYELGPDTYLEIMYHRFYENNSSSENNYSVVTRLVHGDNKYLFTGDLESQGETSLVEYYRDNHGGLGKHIMYKGGHHGSSTSSNANLLAAIEPEYIIICTCAGTTEYSSIPGNEFPTQTMINRIALYTDKVYITTLIIDYAAGQFTSMNGDIIFRSTSKGEITVTGSNNNTILKDTDWFKNNRTMPPEWADAG